MVEDIQKYRKILNENDLRDQTINMFRRYFTGNRGDDIWDDLDLVRENLSINHEGLVSYVGNVNLRGKIPDGILPLKFDIVTGDFYSRNNRLESLEGCPNFVHGQFTCEDNPIKSYEGIPKQIEGELFVSWIKDVPMLRLLNYKQIYIKGDGRINKLLDIFEKYARVGISRRDILACQKEMIDAGFEGNAKW